MVATFALFVNTGSRPPSATSGGNCVRSLRGSIYGYPSRSMGARSRSFLQVRGSLCILTKALLTQKLAEVFGTFTKGEGWSSLGLSLLVSQSAIMFLIVGEFQAHPWIEQDQVTDDERIKAPMLLHIW